MTPHDGIGRRLVRNGGCIRDQLEEAAVVPPEGEHLGGRVVRNDVPLVERLAGLVGIREEELGRGEAEEGRGAGDAILRALEGVVGAGFRGVVRAEDREVVAAAELVDPHQAGRVEVVLVRVDPEEDDQGIDDEEIEREHRADEGREGSEGVSLESIEIDGVIVHEGTNGEGVEVDPNLPGEPFIGLPRAIRRDVAEAKIGAKGVAEEGRAVLEGFDQLHDEGSLARTGRASEEGHLFRW